MELMGLGDLSKYLWENYRYEIIYYPMATHTHTHTQSHTHTHIESHIHVLVLQGGFAQIWD